jgi:hypothetical protein
MIDLRQIGCIIDREGINKRHLAVRPVLNIARPKESDMRFLVILVCTIAAAAAQCNPTATTATGSKAPATICSGDLIFNEEFNTFDLSTWNHEKTAGGGGVSDITCISPHFEVLGLWDVMLCPWVPVSWCLEGPGSLTRMLWKPFILIEWTSIYPPREPQNRLYGSYTIVLLSKPHLLRRTQHGFVSIPS